MQSPSLPRSAASVPGTLCIDHACPSGYVGYYAKDAHGVVVYTVRIPAHRLTPELFARWTEDARQLAVAPPPLHLVR